MKKVISAILALTVCFALASCGNSGSEAAPSTQESSFKKQTIKVSYAGTEQGIDGIAFAKWAELVSAATNGAVTLDGYSDAQLASGDMTRMVELLIQGGAFDMCILSEGPMEGINGEFYATEIPFAFTGYEDVYAHVDSEEGQKWLADQFGKSKLTYLSTLSNGISQLTNGKHAVLEPKDLSDLLIRVYGDSDLRLMRALGANAVSMSWSEVYSALQQGTVDGQINGLQTISSANLQEVQKFVTMLNMTWSGYHMVSNSAAWNNYSPELQSVLKDCAVEAAQYAREYLGEQESQLRSKFEEAGLTFCDPTEEQLAMFKEKALPVAQETISTLSEETIRVWDLG